MSRIGIYSHNPSNSVSVLSIALAALGHRSRVLRSAGNSHFRGRAGDTVINYGSSSTDHVGTVVNNGRVINTPDAVRLAANKTSAFQKFNDAGLSTVESTTSRRQARIWIDEGHVVYCRESTNGHSGEGIVICTQGEAPEDLGRIPMVNPAHLPHYPLYTKGIAGRRRELRVHVAFGQVVLAQQKRRREGYRAMEEYSNVVRNFDTGWIYATSTVVMSDETKALALASVESLGLDFGAVDIITHEDRAWVLEVNTAPGLAGESSRAAYAGAFNDFLDGSITFDLHDAREALRSSQETSASDDIYSMDAELLESLADSASNVPPTAGVRPSLEEMFGSAVRSGTGRARFDAPAGSDGPSAARMDNIPSTPVPNATPGMNQLLREMEEAVGEGVVVPTISAEDLVWDDNFSESNMDDIAAAEPMQYVPPNPWDLDRVPTPQTPAPAIDGMPRTSSAQAEQIERRPNAMDSTAPVAPVDTPTALFGESGHYVVEMSPGINTVVYVAPDGTIYTAEHDLVLQEESLTLITKIAV
jgi:glutathione synthase/RimK-type ligase-like ATP-grasp enzyme